MPLLVKLLRIWTVDSGCKWTTTGVDYMGAFSTTRSGFTCQPWFITNIRNWAMFPDGSATLANNYCRNPANPNSTIPQPGILSSGVWCYTTDQKVLWDVCDVPMCGESSTGPTSYPINNIYYLFIIYLFIWKHILFMSL